MRRRWGLMAVVVAIVWPSSAFAAQRTLTFDDRVVAQERIERVAHAHTVGSDRPFEEAVPRELLERKVRTYLRQSIALERIWHTPVTAAMLQAETDRIGTDTRLPDRLREIRAALLQDEFVFQECFARAALVDRLTRGFFSYDAGIHADARAQIEALPRRTDFGAGAPWPVNIRRVVSDVVRRPDRPVPSSVGPGAPDGAKVEDPSGSPGEPSSADDEPGDDRRILARPQRFLVGTDEFAAWRSRLPSVAGQAGPVIEEADHFEIRTLLSEQADRFQIETDIVPKMSMEDWWSAQEVSFDETGVEAVAAPRLDGSATVAAGAPQCFSADTWNNGTLGSLPDPRQFFTSVWTGNVVIIWGGGAGGANSPWFSNTGARYNPLTDTWAAMSAVNAPVGRAAHSAVWTGTEMIVWGGVNGSLIQSPYLNTGGRYDPVADTWRPMATTKAPTARSEHVAVWTGREMVVWGGHAGQFDLEDPVGGRYNPATDTWTATTKTGAPTGRARPAVAWTGSVMVVWGGFSRNGPVLPQTGGRYDPVLDRWMPTSAINVPAGRQLFAYTWSGQELIVWGGVGGTPTYFNTGGRYDPVADRWTATSTSNAPLGRYDHSAVWASDSMIVWGGVLSGGAFTQSGARYSPQTDTWSPISSQNAPADRSGHAAVWTGDRMVVWGGRQGPISSFNLTSTGGRYDPATDSWTPTSTSLAASARFGHTAVWTGNLMVVWGGQAFGTTLGTGGRFDPLLDAWTPVSTRDAPVPRSGHTAVWTGARMVVWGGSCGQSSCGPYLASGGRYDPLADAWTRTASVPFLSGRTGHSAVWTGHEMVVWGGDNNGIFAFPDGGRYDPVSDSWRSMARPSGLNRTQHTAVWTGTEMLVWGGFVGSTSLASNGGRYDPAADRWVMMSVVNQPDARVGHSAVWTGKEMIVWGGQGTASEVETGGRYDPATDLWSATPLFGAPAQRSRHSAVWTGREMVVWGRGAGCVGFPYQCVGDDIGGAFDPQANTWSPVATLASPGRRSGQSTVWTGDLMLVWGGDGGGYPLGNGGAYAREAVNPPPAPEAGPDQTVECAESAGTRVTLSGSAMACGHAGALRYTWSGSFLENGGLAQGTVVTVTVPLGAHTLTLTVEDEFGQSASDTVTVDIVDSIPPVVECPSPQPAECSGPEGTSVGLAPATARDACDPDPAITNTWTTGGEDASGSYPLGATQVEFEAQDASGNSAMCGAFVSVRDTTPPGFSVVADPPSLWPPNHRLVPVHVSWQVHDTCDPQPAISLIEVSSSEPDDGVGTGDGSTQGDVVAVEGGGPADMMLRAEREGTGPGRIYELAYRATDASGNTSPALGVVTVPHDVGQGPEPLLMRLEWSGAQGTLRLYWPAVPGAVAYDVIAANLSQVSVDADRLLLGRVRVLARAATETFLSDDPAPLPAGSVILYFVQPRTARGGGGYGTESAPWPRLPTDCDGGCP